MKLIIAGLVLAGAATGVVSASAATTSDKDPIVHIAPDSRANSASVWALTRGGNLLWCRTAGSGTECTRYADRGADQFFSALAERSGDGGSSVWALTRSGHLYWCRPEGLDSIACY